MALHGLETTFEPWQSTPRAAKCAVGQPGGRTEGSWAGEAQSRGKVALSQQSEPCMRAADGPHPRDTQLLSRRAPSHTVRSRQASGP